MSRGNTTSRALRSVLTLAARTDQAGRQASMPAMLARPAKNVRLRDQVNHHHIGWTPQGPTGVSDSQIAEEDQACSQSYVRRWAPSP